MIENNMNQKPKELELYTGKIVRVRGNSFPVDPEKFRKAIKNAGLTYEEASRKIGYNSNGISCALNAGHMTRVMINGLEAFCGIKYEDYAYVPKPKEEPEQITMEAPQRSGEELAQLYNVIKAAVVDGMNEAIAGNMKNLRGAMYTAIYTAINAAKKEAQ